MSEFEFNLLKLSYEHYKNTGDKVFQFQMRNSDDMYFYPAAAEGLSDKGYVEPISDNIGSNTMSPIDESLLIYRITTAGIQYSEQLLKSKM